MATRMDDHVWPAVRRASLFALLVLGPPVLAFAALTLGALAQRPLTVHAAPGAAAPASFRVEVSENGFNGKTDLVLQVQTGQEVEITFVYGDAGLNDPEQRHQIQIDGYDVDIPLDLEHLQSTVKFVADKTGSFTIHCHVKCKGHRALQNGMLVVGAAPAPGAAAGAPPALSTALTMSSVSPVSNGAGATLAATLQDGAGQPLNGAQVTFYIEQGFMGTNGRVSIGSVQTDASGAATIQYQPHADGDQIAVARFDGMGGYAASESLNVLHVEGSSPAYVPAGRSGLDIPGWGPWWIGILLGTVWITYSFVWVQVVGIRQNR